MMFKRTTRVQCIMVTSLGQVEAAPSAWSSPWVRYLAVGEIGQQQFIIYNSKKPWVFKKLFKWDSRLQD